MSIQDSFLRGVLAPALVAALVLCAGWRPWRRATPDGRWSGSPALGLTFFAGFALLVGPPPLPSATRQLAAQEWLAFAALAGGLALALEARWAPLRLVLRPLFALSIALAVVPMRVRRELDVSALEAWQVALLLALPVLWTSNQLLERRARGNGFPASLLVAGSALALTAGLSGSALLAQLAGALTAAVGAFLALRLVRRGASLAGPGVGLWSGLHVGLAFCAASYSSTRPADALILALAPLAAWAGELPALRRRPAWVCATASALAVALPASVVVGRAVLAFDPDPLDY